ncbi:hypothetical protein GBA52_014106 [Prunus armeniaca]|nr:hypothetical protein GBA52_014106 [Prunus armeniaca]
MAARTHRCRFGSRTRNNHFCTLLRKPFFLPQTLKMVATQATSKRPICPSCSKPIRLCLCTRIQTPGLHNSVSVTILQHSLEKNHPLNSTRIARLGLKNLNVVTVCDVNFEARFVIRSLDPYSQTGPDRNGSESSGFDQVVESRETQKLVFKYCDEVSSGKENVGESEFGLSANFPKEKNISSLIESDEKCKFGGEAQNQLGGVYFVSNSGLSTSDVLVVGQEHEFTDDKHLDGQDNADEVSTATTLDAVSKLSNEGFDSVEGIQTGNDVPVIAATIGKYGVISCLCHIWMAEGHCKNPNFDTILDNARDALAEGFVVQKLQKQPLKGSEELNEYVEFEMEVPPGSVLLFPSEEAVSVSDLEAMNQKVKNLIVLDGTWSKAKRMYVENPWLKLLPHLKLELDKMSLYDEVRLQPKLGFLSTIESIVYALQAVGDSPEGLDNLLDVFESMVEDQKRCKKERLSNVSPSG